jgi:creatinine amidohydrolase
MTPLLLETLAWPEVAELREKNGGLLLLPLGATEQHGPHLPVAMDTLLAEAVCHAVSENTGVPVMSALRYTVSQGHTAKWPGTFSLSHQTFISVLNELADWALATGWRRLLLVNSHFGNDASARVAVDQIRLRHLGKLQIGLRNVYQLRPEIQAAYSADAADLHANAAETSLMLHLHPDLVRMDRLENSDDPDRTGDSVFSYPVAQTSLNGVTGSPSLASAEQGKQLFGQMVAALTEDVQRAIHEQAPLPASHWETLIS